MARHFKLTNETKINAPGITLFRIECTVDCRWAKVGDKGGWVEKEENIQGGNAWVSGSAEVSGSAVVSGSAEVSGSAVVRDSAEVSDWAEVSGSADYCCFQSFGSRGGTTTAFRCKDGKVRVKCGCFNGTLDEFSAKVEQTHGDNEYGKVYKAIIEVIKLRFNI
jgi:hypothetical protein